MSGGRDSSLPSALAGGSNGTPTTTGSGRKERQKSVKKRKDERAEEDDAPKADVWNEYNALAELLDGDVSRDTLAARSEVTEMQVIVFSQARQLAAYYGLPILDDIVDHMLRLNISKGRKSRTEFVKSFQMAMQGESANNPLNNMMDNFRR